MKINLEGLDVLRGIGIFVLLVMHTGFYYFDGLYQLDLNNPPLIVTVIGFLLMFAGLFAMISGFVHTYQSLRKVKQKVALTIISKHSFKSGLFILVIAYLYFIFTGPGIVDMSNQTMNNSLLVELIQSQQLIWPNVERLLYIDSLVMIGTNILLLTIVFKIQQKFFSQNGGLLYLFSALIFIIISLIRITLYPIFLNALESKNWSVVLSLNWFVNKNNPIFPYFSFALFGGWLATLLVEKSFKTMIKQALLIGLSLFLIGLTLYIFLPDTMLQRYIDPIWFAIMITQMGLFICLISVALIVFDYKDLLGSNRFVNFFKRFGIAGLTLFFIESVISAFTYLILRLIFPNIAFNIPQALLFGLILAICSGLFLIIWEQSGYKYGIEYLYGKVLSKTGGSLKTEKLKRKLK